MTTHLDNTVAVLWGSTTREVTWVHLSPKHGRVTVALARPTGFWVRDSDGVPDIEIIADYAQHAWERLRDGEDLPDWATHRLAPPHMQDIEPLPKGEL